MTGDRHDPEPGEAEDFDEFYDKYETRTYAYSYARLGNHHDAEETVSDAFATVARHWDRVRYGPGCTRSYLFTVLHNEIIKRLKPRSTRPETLWDPTDGQAVASLGPVVGDFAGQTADHVTIMQALSQLPDEQREAVLLFHFSDMSIADIAAATGGISPNTAKHRVRAGRKRLYEILTENADTREDDLR